MCHNYRIYLVAVVKLSRLEHMNRIIGDSDFKRHKFEHRFWSDSKSDVDFVATIQNPDVNLSRISIEIRDDFKIFQNFNQGRLNHLSLAVVFL